MHGVKGRLLKCCVCLFLMISSAPARAATDVLCTTFPIYQITRHVVQGREGVSVALMLPASLGCPHHYSLTPQDMQKLARADVLVVNGLGMEEFLGAPIEKANPDLRIVDSSQGIDNLLQFEGGRKHDHAHGDAPFEWAGVFDLKPGVYRWTFAKVNGKYADPTMNMVIFPAPGKEAAAAIEQLQHRATKAFEADTIQRDERSQLTPGEQAYKLVFSEAKDVTTFRVQITKAGAYAFYTEHMPTEFEAAEHFFKDAGGADVEPLAQEPDHDHGHDHGNVHGHKAEHDDTCDHDQGVNPHLFASPRMAALLAMNIAAGISKADPQGAGIYFRNATAYAAAMNALADEMAAAVKTLRNNRIVQPHGIFDYLARDIGLEIVAVTQPHGQEPSAAEMLKLVETILEKKAGAIFTEPQYSPKVGQTLARETGIATAVLDPVASGPDNAPLDYYEQVMRQNIATLRASLGVDE